MAHILKAFPVLAHHLVAELLVYNRRMLSEGGKWSLRKKTENRLKAGWTGAVTQMWVICWVCVSQE